MISERCPLCGQEMFEPLLSEVKAKVEEYERITGRLYEIQCEKCGYRFSLNEKPDFVPVCPCCGEPSISKSRV